METGSANEINGYSNRNGSIVDVSTNVCTRFGVKVRGRVRFTKETFVLFERPSSF